MKFSTKDITICGMFAALIILGAFLKIDIPLPFYTMHFTLQWFWVLMAGLLLGARLGSLSVITYLMLGLVGLPVFAAGGGPQYILRPGFGFLLGFVLAAFVMGLIMDKARKTSFVTILLTSSLGLVLYYTVGAIYFYLIKNLYVGDIIPFKIVVVEYCLITVLPDFILCIIASVLSDRLKPHTAKILNQK